MALDIVQLGHSDESIRPYLERYKACRLHALKTEPEMFGSTFEREIQFTDDQWYSRLANPVATTFFALQQGRIASTLTVVGPLKYGSEEHLPGDNPWQAAIETSQDSTPLLYCIAGMYTVLEFRGQGIATVLLERAIKYAREEASALGRPFIVSVDAYQTNIAAVKLYQKFGFVQVKRQPSEKGIAIIQFRYSTSLASAVP